MNKKTKITLGVLVFILLAISATSVVMSYHNQKTINKIGKILMGANNNKNLDEALSNKLNELADNVKPHDIWDDKKVVEAIKKKDDSTLDEKGKFIYKKVNEILSKIIKKNMTNYQKEKAVYDWLVKFTKYDSESRNPDQGSPTESKANTGNDNSGEDKKIDNYTPYGVLKNKEAICVGNATTFKLFMDVLDIPCKLIHSTVYGEHAWCMVELDKKWYHVDPTFENLNPTTKEPNYTWLNVSDAQKMKDSPPDNLQKTGPDKDNPNLGGGSYPWDLKKFPKANSMKYTYAYKNVIKLDNIYDLPKVMKKALDSKKGNLYIIFKDTNLTEDDVQSVSTKISDIVDNLSIFFEPILLPNGETIYNFSLDTSSMNKDSKTGLNLVKFENIVNKIFK